MSDIVPDNIITVFICRIEQLIEWGADSAEHVSIKRELNRAAQVNGGTVPQKLTEYLSNKFKDEKTS